MIKYLVYLGFGADYYDKVIYEAEYEEGYRVSFMNYYHIFFRILLYNCRILVALLQGYEWNAMMYIIYTQKHRRIEEILFDHNYENMTASWNDQLNYRKREICIFRWYLFATVLNMVWISIAIFYNNFFFEFLDQPTIIMSILCLLLALKFVILFWQIYKYHKFEFHRIFRESLMLLLCILVSLSFIIVNYRVYVRVIFNKEFYYYTIDDICESDTFYATSFSSILFFYSNVFMLNDVLLCFAIIKVKSPQDVIQGISKLDYLLKVSVFQIYKDPKLRLTKYQIDRMSSKLRESRLYESYKPTSEELNERYSSIQRKELEEESWENPVEE